MNDLLIDLMAEYLGLDCSCGPRQSPQLNQGARQRKHPLTLISLSRTLVSGRTMHNQCISARWSGRATSVP